jgi:branched-chain amino acid transport system substrate-binding protein
MRKQALFILAAALMLNSSARGLASAADASPYPINVVLSMTGQGAFVGTAQHDTLVVLEGLENKHGGIQGHPIKFIFHDDQTSPQVAVQTFNAILAERPAVVIGPSIAVTCKAAAPLIANGPVTYCLSPSATPTKGGFLFSAISSTHDQIDGLFRYFRARGWNRVAVLNPTDTTGQDSDDAIAAAMAKPENHGTTIVAQEHFTITDLSVSAQLAKVKAANPQVLVSWTTGTPFATVLRAISDTGLNVPLIGSPGNMTYAQMKQYAGILPKDLYFPTEPYVLEPPQPRLASAQREFADAFRAISVRPDLQTGIAWDAAKLMILALRKFGPSATAAQVRDYLQTVHGYVGISGVYDFRDGSDRGLSVNDVLLARWDPAAGTWVAASQLGFGALK